MEVMLFIWWSVGLTILSYFMRQKEYPFNLSLVLGTCILSFAGPLSYFIGKYLL